MTAVDRTTFVTGIVLPYFRHGGKAPPPVEMLAVGTFREYRENMLAWYGYDAALLAMVDVTDDQLRAYARAYPDVSLVETPRGPTLLLPPRLEA